MMVVCWRQGSGQAARAPSCHCQPGRAWPEELTGLRPLCVALSPSFKCNQHMWAPGLITHPYSVGLKPANLLVAGWGWFMASSTWQSAVLEVTASLCYKYWGSSWRLQEVGDNFCLLPSWCGVSTCEAARVSCWGQSAMRVPRASTFACGIRLPVTSYC